jgi:outer membrane protein TolC
MKKAVLFLLLASFGVSVLAAQTISLEEVRTLALLNSRSLAKANLNMQSLALSEKSRLQTYLPSLSLGANATMNLWNSSNAEPIKNPFDTFNAGASASISESITFHGSRALIEKAINELSSESAKKDALAEYFSVIDSADNAYYAVLEAMATIEADEQSLQTAMASLSIAEIRRTSGMISPGDYIRALAEKESRENSRNQARRSLNLAAAKLRSLTGLSAMPQLDQIDFSKYEELILRLGNISDEEADLVYGKFLALIFTSNPSFAKASLADQRAEKNLNMAKLGYVPSLSASFSTGLNYSLKNGYELSAGKLSLTLSIPIDFWVASNNIEKSKIARESSALDYIGAVTQLETDLQSALINCFGYAGSVLSSRRSLDYAQTHFNYVMERYRLSQGSASDINEASSLLINSRNSYIRAHYGFLQSLSKLRSMAAIDNEERLVNILMGNPP